MSGATENPPVSYPKEVHTDERRAILELSDAERGYAVQQFDVFKSIPLGNHYHKSKHETFCILEGYGVVLMQSVDQDGVPCGDLEKYELQKGAVVRVMERMAHTFVLAPGSRMICVSSKAWDQNDMDLNPCVLVKPEEAARLLENPV